MTAHNGSRSLTLLLVATVFLLLARRRCRVTSEIRTTLLSFMAGLIYVESLFRIWIVGTE